MQDAWNRGEFRGYMAAFKNPDVGFVSGGRFAHGWQGILDHYIRDYGASRASETPPLTHLVAPGAITPQGGLTPESLRPRGHVGA
jgi:hypothetical protein